MCCLKPLSVSHLLEKTNTSVFFNCDHWEWYQSRSCHLVLLEHGRTSDGFESYLKWVSCCVLPWSQPLSRKVTTPLSFLSMLRFLNTVCVVSLGFAWFIVLLLAHREEWKQVKWLHETHSKSLDHTDGGSYQGRWHNFPATVEGRVRCCWTPGWLGAPLWS